MLRSSRLNVLRDRAAQASVRAAQDKPEQPEVTDCSILATSAVSILATNAVRFNARLQPAVEDEPVALHGSITCGSTEASLAVLDFRCPILPALH